MFLYILALSPYLIHHFLYSNFLLFKRVGRASPYSRALEPHPFNKRLRATHVKWQITVARADYSGWITEYFAGL